MGEDGLSAYSALPTACPELCNTSPFSAFTMPLYLVFRGRLPELPYGISGVWVLGPKLQFQMQESFKTLLRMLFFFLG
jgi:hypothetical protein